MRHLTCVLLAILSVSCTKKTEFATILRLERSEVAMMCEAGNATLQLTANAEWSVAAASVPDWLLLEPAAGNGTRTITLSAVLNEETEERGAKIVFTCGDKAVELAVSQKGAKPREMAFSNLAVSYADKVEYVLGGDGTERLYDFTVREMFINPETAMAETIFLGNLVNRKMDSSTAIAEYRGYTLLPITVVAVNAWITPSRTFVPSKAEQDSYARGVMEENYKQNEHFISNMGGVEYNSHRELHLIGMGNMAVALDDVFAGKSYREQEMTARCGVIYSFSQSVFTLIQDLERYIVEEELSENDFPTGTLSYVNSVSYGRVGLLIVESNHGKADIGRVVNKIMSGCTAAELSAEDNAVLSGLVACRVYYKSGKMVVEKGGEEVIRAYGKPITTTDDIFPFRFTVSGYFDREAASEMKFRLQLP